jgi:hypothetical protein
MTKAGQNLTCHPVNGYVQRLVCRNLHTLQSDGFVVSFLRKQESINISLEWIPAPVFTGKVVRNIAPYMATWLHSPIPKPRPLLAQDRA